MRFLLLLFAACLHATPQYYCTGANWAYFESLMNLIGSIHRTNYDQLVEIAVLDFGLEPEQVALLQSIEKVTVEPLQKTHPQMLDYYREHGLIVFGWYAWKPVAIKQALARLPYVLWLDAGTEIRNPMDHLFEYIQKEDYFICTIGDQCDAAGNWLHPVGWGATSLVKNHFGLEEPEKKWILNKESVMGGVIGATRQGASFFLDDLYELSKDLRYYADDGTASQGWGSARHDQVLLSYFAYSRNLKIHQQDGMRGQPIRSLPVPLYITWSKDFVTDKTEIFNCRTDKTNHLFHCSQIHYQYTESNSRIGSGKEAPRI